MRNLHLVAAIGMLLALSGGIASAGPSRTTDTVSANARRAALKLATAWVETASPAMLNALALRTCAFAGMVPHVSVVVDGHSMDASTALVGSGATILGNNDTGADARAVRNTVAVLTQIAEGCTK